MVQIGHAKEMGSDKLSKYLRVPQIFGASKYDEQFSRFKHVCQIGTPAIVSTSLLLFNDISSQLYNKILISSIHYINL